MSNFTAIVGGLIIVIIAWLVIGPFIALALCAVVLALALAALAPLLMAALAVLPYIIYHFM